MTPEEAEKIIIDNASRIIARHKKYVRTRMISPGMREIIRDAQSNTVKYEPAAWLGRPLDNAERKCFSRTVKDLHDRGVVIGLRNGDADRISHLRLVREVMA